MEELELREEAEEFELEFDGAIEEEKDENPADPVEDEVNRKFAFV